MNTKKMVIINPYRAIILPCLFPCGAPLGVNMLDLSFGICSLCERACYQTSILAFCSRVVS